MEFKEELKMIRSRLSMTRAQLAVALGCSEPLIARLEIGKRLPSFEIKKRVIRLCEDRDIDRNLF